MNPHFEFISVNGQWMHRITLKPNPGTADHGLCFFTHGQGDYGERYLDVLHPFTERGITCIITDLLGHGRSPGPRGHVGNLAHIDALISEYMEMADGRPFGIAGHSMGGLLTLRHLKLALDNTRPLPAYCWVNAPLIHPGSGHAAWFVRLAHLLAELSPLTSIHTGVTPEMCSHSGEITGKLPKDPASLGHQRVSLSWGVQLISMAEAIRPALLAASCDIPFLYTQGGADSVCPVASAREFFNQLHWSNKQYTEFPDMRHETYAEANRQLLFDTINQWLDAALEQHAF